MNVERAYREFRHEATDARWDHAKVFDAVMTLAKAKAKGIAIEFWRGQQTHRASR